MSTKEKKKKLTLKNFTGSAPSSVNKIQVQKTSAIFGKKEDVKLEAPVSNKTTSEETLDLKSKSAPKVNVVEKPKSAKEWAKVKIQEELSRKADKKLAGKKRDYRLTVTKALSEEERKPFIELAEEAKAQLKADSEE